MRKIRLEVEELIVESFDTAGRRGRDAGTVRGHDDSFWECNVSDGSYCATCGYGGQMCPQDTMTCFASCLMTRGDAACIEPHCGGA